MTRHLYWEDPALAGFEARVVRGRAVDGGRSEVVLDATAFCPEAGGQPADRGELAGVTVVGVREEGGRIVHLLEGPPPSDGALVAGHIDLERRRDLSCQHTAQHIVSAIAEDRHGARTVGFHLGEEATTVDFEGLEPSALPAVEEAANAVARRALPVTTAMVEGGDLRRGDRREQVEGTVRLVRIAGFDENACCGTHVANTAEVAPILLGRTERVRGALRVELRAGDRALAEVRRQRRTLEDLSRASGAGPLELAGWAAATLADVKELRRELTAARGTLAGLEARDLEANAETRGPFRVVARALNDRPSGALRDLARELSLGTGLIAILGAADSGKSGIVVARGAGVPVDAREILAAAAAVLGARGGGRAELAQAGGGDPALLGRAVALAAAECDRLLAAGAQGEEMSEISVRRARATAGDARVIHRFIRELAAYEREPDAAEATPESLLADLAARPRPFECLLAEKEGEPAGFALYFFNYSTWKGRPGLYIEDLYVPPPLRARGIGRALFVELARIARARGCGRMEWSVLDWNAPAIRFYERFGARGMGGWTVYRLAGEALAALAEGGPR